VRFNVNTSINNKSHPIISDPPFIDDTRRHETPEKFLFRNGELSLLWPGVAASGDGAWVARTGSGPMLMRGDIFAASRGGGAVC
jgi:hypothetical protein